MLCSWPTFVLPFLVLEAFARRNDPLPLYHRSNSSDPPTIETTILSINGSNVSALFRTMVYRRPEKVVSNSSLNDRQVASPRQIDTCEGYTAVRFLHSRCQHKGWSRKPNLQEYYVDCRVKLAHSNIGPGLRRNIGHCAPEEICINQPWPTEYGDVIANCVSKSDFKEVEDSRLPSLVEKTENFMAAKELAGHKMAMLVSKPDGQTPLGARLLEMETMADAGLLIQKSLCKECYGLRTGKNLSSKAKALIMKITMMDMKAIAGFVWLSFL